MILHTFNMTMIERMRRQRELIRLKRQRRTLSQKARSVHRTHRSNAQAEIEETFRLYHVTDPALMNEFYQQRFSAPLWKDLYRLSPSTFEAVLTAIAPYFIQRTGRPRVVSMEESLRMVLLRMSNRFPSVKLIARFHQHARSTCDDAMADVVKAIIMYLGHHIRFPATAAERARAAEEFAAIAGFPDVIGAIDGTHVHIVCPDANALEEASGSKPYYCRHHRFGIVLSLVCNAQCRITSAVIGHAGSVHDSAVFENSLLFRRAATLIPPPYHLLGDSAYTLRAFCMTMYKQLNDLTPGQDLYRQKHSCTRQVIERCIGLWKMRFRAFSGDIEMSLQRLAEFVQASLILHNLCIASSDTAPQHWEQPDDCDEQVETGYTARAETRGSKKRERLEELFVRQVLRETAQ